MEMQTSLANAVDSSDKKEKYDANAKLLLSHKEILAWILKGCALEFKDFSIEFIRDYCIEGIPEISIKAVHQNEKDISTGTSRIIGDNTEDINLSEGKITYDIRFTAIVPKTNETIQLFINVEAQVDTTPGYPIIKRAIYYCSRMISAQHGTVFENEEYGKIRKVYSIWVCPDPPKKKQNSITKYHMGPELIEGNVVDKEQDYDLLDVVIISVGKEAESENKLLQLLNTLFTSGKTSSQTKKILETEFGIQITVELGEEVERMCNLSDAIWNEGKAEGKAEGRIVGNIEVWRELGIHDADIVSRLMEKYNLTEDAAKQYLLVPA